MNESLRFKPKIISKKVRRGDDNDADVRQHPYIPRTGKRPLTACRVVNKYENADDPSAGMHLSYARLVVQYWNRHDKIVWHNGKTDRVSVKRSCFPLQTIGIFRLVADYL